MKSGNVYVCNVCGIKSDDDANSVFIKAHKNDETVHICTACIPSVIHGSGEVVKENSEIENEFFEEYKTKTN